MEEQIKVVEVAIKNGKFDKVCELADKGYVFNIACLDMLRNSGQEKILDQILCSANIRGISHHIFEYLLNYKGEDGLVELVRKYRATNRVFANCVLYFDDAMLEKLGEWQRLCENRRFDLLAKNKQFDVIIKSNLIYSEAIKILKDNDMAQRVIELGEERWLMTYEWQPEGLDILVKSGYIDKLLARHSKDNHSLPNDIRTLASTEEGRELLREKGMYRWLTYAGYPSYMVEDRKWGLLYKTGYYRLIDWNTWFCDSPKPQAVIDAAEHVGAWQFLANIGCNKLLFKHKKWKLLFKNLFNMNSGLIDTKF